MGFTIIGGSCCIFCNNCFGAPFAPFKNIANVARDN